MHIKKGNFDWVIVETQRALERAAVMRACQLSFRQHAEQRVGAFADGDGDQKCGGGDNDDDDDGGGGGDDDDDDDDGGGGGGDDDDDYDDDDDEGYTFGHTNAVLT